jgi:Excalibur calcium-binding domain
LIGGSGRAPFTPSVYKSIKAHWGDIVKKLRYVCALAVSVVLVLGPTAQAQNAVSCADFPFQAAAQSYLRANPDDSSRLDENGDGVACETYPYPPGSPREEDPVTPPQTATKDTPLPQSGGPSLVAVVSLLSGLFMLGLGLRIFSATRAPR